MTELNRLLKQIPSSRNCKEDGLNSWLDCDADNARFQLMMISGEDKVIETSKISYSDAFAKGMTQMEQ